MLEVLDETAGDVVALRITGKHIHGESHKLAGMIDARIATYGHARCFIEITETDGVELSALKEDLQFELEHGDQIRRCAVVGEHSWERWLVRILSLYFRSADIQFFPENDRGRALEWLGEE
jgi:hypothetical protein